MNARKIIKAPWVVDTWITRGLLHSQTHLIVTRLVAATHAEHARDDKGRLIVFRTEDAAQAEADKRNALELDALRRQVEREAKAMQRVGAAA